MVEPIDALLDRMEPPEPSSGLVNRLYAASIAARGPRARGSAHAPPRPWAFAAAAGAAVVAAAYLWTDDRRLVPATSLPIVEIASDARVVVAEGDAAVAARLGAVHPADAAAADEGEPDDEDVALADIPVDEPDVPLI